MADERRAAHITDVDETIRLLREENESLLAHAEDMQLLAVIAEEVADARNAYEVSRCGLERIAILKDISLCMVGTLEGDEVSVTGAYHPGPDEEFENASVRLAEPVIAELAAGSTHLVRERIGEVTFIVRGAPREYPASAILLVPRNRPDGTSVLYLFADDRSESRLRKIDAMLHRAVDVLESRTETLRLLDALARSGEAKSEFMRSMSHEFRTPLNSIIGFSALLLRDHDGLTDEQRKQLQLVQNSGQHLLHLVSEILDLARIEAGKLCLEIASFDALALARETLLTLGPFASDKGLELSLEAPAGTDVIELESDPVKIRQILLNLLGNAVMYTDSGYALLRVERIPPATVAFTVSDSGPGIDPKYQEQVFGEFMQVTDENSTRTDTTGLGLAISRRLAEALGGKISVQSRFGEGSNFTLLLPERPTD